MVERRIHQLTTKLENYINLCSMDRLYEVHVFYEVMDPAIHADPRTNQVTSFWIQENYTCMRKQNVMEFRNLTITN